VPAILSEVIYFTQANMGRLFATKSMVEKMIAEGFFRPIDSPKTGLAREWSLQDVIRLIAFLQLRAAGCRLDVGRAIGRLDRFQEGGGFLVVTSYERPIKYPHGRDKGEAPAQDSSDPWGRVMWEQRNAETHQAIVFNADELKEELIKARPGVLAFHVLPLNEIERLATRIFKRAEKGSEKFLERRRKAEASPKSRGSKKT